MRCLPFGTNPVIPFQKNNEQHLNTMKCPVCTEPDLVMTERQGVEIDYCPKCRGVWLDRGELDKIVERSTAVSTVAPTPNPPLNAPPGYGGYPQGYPDHHDKHGQHGQHGYYRRKSWLGELFD
jgi:Zn-finger nucleic acid-binding protein